MVGCVLRVLTAIIFATPVYRVTVPELSTNLAANLAPRSPPLLRCRFRIMYNRPRTKNEDKTVLTFPSRVVPVTG